MPVKFPGEVRLQSIANLGRSDHLLEFDLLAVVCHDTWLEWLLCTFSIISVSPPTGQPDFVVPQ
jgi:hypothetical protein